MALKNTQYDTIMREYHRRQLTNKRRQDECTAEAYTAVPELSEIDSLIASLSVEHAKKLLNGDNFALEDLKEQIAALEADMEAAACDYALFLYGLSGYRIPWDRKMPVLPPGSH